MTSKQPVVLVVMIETTHLRWFTAAMTLEGDTIPLLRSEENDLSYQQLEFDEQVSFVRHRFSGVLQQACDRLWSRQQKARQFVFLFERELPSALGELTHRVADHFFQWMTNPPVLALLSESGFDTDRTPRLEVLAGECEPNLAELLRTGLPQLLKQVKDYALWELPRGHG